MNLLLGICVYRAPAQQWLAACHACQGLRKMIMSCLSFSRFLAKCHLDALATPIFVTPRDRCLHKRQWTSGEGFSSVSPGSAGVETAAPALPMASQRAMRLSPSFVCRTLRKLPIGRNKSVTRMVWHMKLSGKPAVPAFPVCK